MLYVWFLASIGLCLGQDPAHGWLGYAKAVSPTGGRLTYMEASWKVGSNPKSGGAFFSPWFGIESADNLNLIQPVNPWTGNHWEIYNEYFQWKPVHNENSRSHNVKAGDTLFGAVSFNAANQSYTVQHSSSDGWSVTSEINVQKSGSSYKNYTIGYVVFEKKARCSQYPSDGEVTFYNIKMEYDGKVVTPKWTTAYVDDVCNNRAAVVDSKTIKISWNTEDEVSLEATPVDPRPNIL